MAVKTELIINSLSNSVDGEDWEKLRDRAFDYHISGHGVIGFDPLANMPRDKAGNILTRSSFVQN